MFLVSKNRKFDFHKLFPISSHFRVQIPLENNDF